MRLTGAKLAVRALEDEGIPFAFGIPGTHNIELWDELAVAPTCRAVLVTDEMSASFMADGVWRATGKLACACLVPGAGLTHAISGVAEAFLDHAGMLVLGCGIRNDTGRAFQLHDIDQLALARPVSKAALRPERGDQVYGLIREACALARRPPAGPVFVEVPANLLMFQHDVHPGTHPPAPEVPAALDEALVERAAELLNGMRRPLLYLGLGAAAAGHDLVALAERLQAPVCTTFQGKGVLAESHPLALWPGFGPAAPPFARQVAATCDGLLAIGCRFGEVATGSYGLAPPGPLIHVDADASALGRNLAAALAVPAEAGAFVRALLPRLRERGADDELRARIRAGHQALRDERARGAGGERVSPARLLAALQAALGPEAIYTADSGNGTFLAMEGLRLEAPGRFLAPVDFSCMGYAVPAAIGAKLSRPDAPVVALAGDGAFLMTGLELLTAAQQGAGVAVLVLRDGELAQIAQFQRTALGRQTCTALPDYDLEALARGLGVDFLRMERDADIEPALDRLRDTTAQGRPMLVDVAIDYGEQTWFTRGVVKTNFLRLPWRERFRFVGRAVTRRVLGS